MAWELVGSFTNYRKYGGGFNFDLYRYKFVKVANTGVTIFTDAVGYPNGKSLYRFSSSEPNIEYVVPDGSALEAELRVAGPLWHKSGVGVVNVYRELRNTEPSITLSTANAQTLYENDTLDISGTAQDVDSGNTVTVKYSINNGTARTLHTFVSDGSAVSFNKPLTFKRDKLHDGSTEVTGDLQEGITHTLRVWAEDDQGGKSTIHSRTFNVIPNRPEVKVNGQSRVVETISCKVNGQVREVVKMWVKVNGELREV